MRALVRLIAALVVLALTSCGGGNEQNRGAGGKQTRISAAAYPAVVEFVDADVDRADQYERICDKLANLSVRDKVAAAQEEPCRINARTFAKFLMVRSDVSKCRDGDCAADTTERAFRELLRGLKDSAAANNRGLERALEPGDCLEALKLSESDVKSIDAALDRLPNAMKRLRAGERIGINDIFGTDVTKDRDPKPCKP